MANDRTTQDITEELQEWIPLRDAAKLHPNLTAEMLGAWQRVGLIQNGESGIRIWLPSKLLGKTRLARARDIADYIDARKPNAPKELVERFAQ